MFLRLCGPPSIPLSFTVAGVLPGGMLNAFAWPLNLNGPRAGIHRLPRGLPGYLILFDTRAFEHQRQCATGRLPSQSGFFVISKHFTATPRIPPASMQLKHASSRALGVEPRFHSTLDMRPTLPLNPMIPDNARTFRITAAAGTELAGPYSHGTCKAPRVAHFIPVKKRFTTHRAVVPHATWLVQASAH